MAGEPVPTRVISSDGIFEAYIQLQGVESEVYQALVIKQEKLSSAYVVSNTGMTFSIHLDCKPLPPTMTVGPQGYMYKDFKCNSILDSKKQGGQMTDFGSHISKLALKGVYTFPTQLAPFRFSPLDTVLTEDAKRLDAATSLLIGVIKLEIRRVSLLDTCTSDAFWDPTGFGLLNEKDKKAKPANIAGFGTAMKVAEVRYIKDKVHPDDVMEPFYTFELKYRTMDVLQAMGILRGPEVKKEKIDQKSAAQYVVDLEPSDDEQDDADTNQDHFPETQEQRRKLQIELDAHKARIREIQAEIDSAKRHQLQEPGPSTMNANARKRKATSLDSTDSDSNSEEEDLMKVDDKAAIVRAIERRIMKGLKKRKAMDGGVVDLSED